MQIRRFSLIAACFVRLLVAQDSHWSSAVALPNVDFTGLTAVQKQTALKVLRAEPCGCGCGMKVAQCRVEDPKCSVSRGMAGNALKSIRDGRSVAEVKASMAEGTGPQKVLEDPVKLSTEGAPSKGSTSARITLVEFSDFECPYCSKAVLDLEAIQKAFPNDVRLIFKQFPLSQIHPGAMLAAQAAVAAHGQGKFWPLHDRMFANHTKLTRANILEWARATGCNMHRLTADLDAAKTKQQVALELKQGEDAGVEGTPTVFVNGKHYNGSLELAPFSEVLRKELSSAPH